MRCGAGWLVASALLVGASALRAQTFDTPSFNTPYGEDGLGLYLLFQNDADDVAGILTWRQSGDVVDLGLRGGLVDAFGEVGLFGGVDLKNELVAADESFPLDVAWVTGFGIGFVPDAGPRDRDFGIVRIPGGVSLGRELKVENSEVMLTPYLYPRLALDILFADFDDEDLHFDVDLGMDAQFAERFKLRMGVTVGENEAIGFGVAF
ncbi:MAG: hypothetical protein ACE5JR_10170 [Gemmatimonadota bacterium]